MQLSRFVLASSHSLSSGPASGGSKAWRQNLITEPQDIATVISIDTMLATETQGSTAALLLTDSWQAKRVAVIGIKTRDKAFQPAYFVPEELARRGVDVISVPVYYPEVQAILGKQTYRSLREIPAAYHPLDIVDVFRRSSKVLPERLGSPQQLSKASLRL